MIKDFIKTNKLSFDKGNRNSTITTLTGYGLHLGLSKEDLQKELAKEIKKDNFILEESNRLWEYCSNHNYKKFWTTKEAKKQYFF